MSHVAGMIAMMDAMELFLLFFVKRGDTRATIAIFCRLLRLFTSGALVSLLIILEFNPFTAMLAALSLGK